MSNTHPTRTFECIMPNGTKVQVKSSFCRMCSRPYRRGKPDTYIVTKIPDELKKYHFRIPSPDYVFELDCERHGIDCRLVRVE